MSPTRCDLHVHSAASVGQDEWYTQLFGCPESYADPVQQYRLCKSRGMSLVTLTDHDTIAGGLVLADQPDFFLSEEVTTLFPETGTVMHVLAWNITPRQHEEIQSRRQDVYRLCEYLNREGIAHGLAHPLLSPNWRLDAEAFERALLLFPTLEGINGLTDRRIEPDLTTILDRLTPGAIAALSQKHGIAPYGVTPHRKALTAGSDDHVHRRCGSVYTEMAGRLTPAAFLAGCMAGQARVAGTQAHLNTMAVCVKNTSYHHLKQRQGAQTGFHNPFLQVADLLAGRDPDDWRSAGARFGTRLRQAMESASLKAGPASDLLASSENPSDEDDARVVDAIALSADLVIKRGLHDLVSAAQEFDFYGMLAAAEDVGCGLVITAPLFFAADHFARQERSAACGLLGRRSRFPHARRDWPCSATRWAT